MPAFNLELFDDAKLCSTNCKCDDGDGNSVQMTKEYSVYCVGCGRECHMPCHKVSHSITAAVKRVPINNRMNAYFGECSYMRIVCDNCANLLITNVPSGEKSCFLTLFNRLAKTNNEAKDSNVADTNDSGAPLPHRNKKRKADDTIDEHNEAISDIKRLLEKCFVKLSNVENVSSQVQSTVVRNGEQLDKLDKSNIDSSKNLTKKLDDIVGEINITGTKCDSNGQLLNDINTK